ncbi:MAG: PepSY domain-containing protein [Clostridiales bacterium]|nr:PepSY domain-containing protein [Clostridiales bacterium]
MTRKRRLAIIIAAAVALAIAMCTGIFAYAKDIAEKNSIGIDAALVSAMTDAGATEEDTTITKAKMDFDKGVFVYDIEFTVAGTGKYDYTVKASDGTIIDKDFNDGDVAVTDLAVTLETTTAEETQGVYETVEETTAAAEITTAAEQTTAAPATTSAPQTTNAPATTQSSAATTAAATTKAAATNSSSSGISLAKAKSIALSKAGASESEVTFTKAKTDYDDGITVYDIEFVTSSYKYEFEIDLSGNIVSYDKEAIIITAAATTKAAATSSSSSGISLAKAKSIALSKAGASESEVTFTKAKTDYDDGITVYDIEFVTSSYKYEFEIDLNGNIVSYDKERIQTATTASVSTNYIGVDKAKSIALKNAGLSSSGVTFTKAKLEREDGVYVYEIEFISAGIEYEYEINATTGKILSQSSESYYD